MVILKLGYFKNHLSDISGKIYHLTIQQFGLIICNRNRLQAEFFKKYL